VFRGEPIVGHKKYFVGYWVWGPVEPSWCYVTEMGTANSLHTSA